MLCTLPGGLIDESGTVHGEVRLRALSGREEELLAARRGATSAAQVTEIITRCVERIGGVHPVNAATARELLVADRQFILLHLRQATFGDQVRGSAPCPWPDCGRQVGVSFSTGDVPVHASQDKGPVYGLTLSEAAMPGAGPANRSVEFRLPNGADQEVVSPLLAGNDAGALAAVLERCVGGIGSAGGGRERVEGLSPLARQEIEREMERVAPSVDLLMTAECPECGREFAAPFDLQHFFFGELRVTGDMLLREVHYLAYHYHWSESEIMDMTRDRRRRYVEVLADEIERLNESA
jgi:hypothetical protein